MSPPLPRYSSASSSSSSSSSSSKSAASSSLIAPLLEWYVGVVILISLFLYLSYILWKWSRSSKHESAYFSFTLAATAADRQQWVNAIKYYEEAIQNAGNQANQVFKMRCLAGRGLCYLEQGEFAMSFNDLNAATQLAQLQIADQSMERKDVSKDDKVATTTTTTTTTATTTSLFDGVEEEIDYTFVLSQLFYSRGLASDGLGHDKVAIADYMRAIDLDGTFSFVSNRTKKMALIERLKNEKNVKLPQEALDELERSIQIREMRTKQKEEEEALKRKQRADREAARKAKEAVLKQRKAATDNATKEDTAEKKSDESTESEATSATSETISTNSSSEDTKPKDDEKTKKDE